jgi:hypothetical protein
MTVALAAAALAAGASGPERHRTPARTAPVMRAGGARRALPLMAVLAACATLAAACERAPTLVGGSTGGGGPSGNAQGGTLFPAMTVGTTWTYQFTDSVEGGPPPTKADTFGITKQIVVADSVDSTGVRWSGMNNGAYQPLGDDLSSVPSYYSNRNGGFWFLAFSVAPPAVIPPTFYLMFKYPAKRGDTYYPTANLAFVQRDLVTVTASDTLITVPAGSFHCLRYDLNGLDVMFVAPGIGIVKRVSGLWLDEDATGRVLSNHRNVLELQSLITP